MNAKYYIGCIYGVNKRKLVFIFRIQLKTITLSLKIIKEPWYFFQLFRNIYDTINEICRILESSNLQVTLHCIKNSLNKQFEINVRNILIYCDRFLR